MNRYATSEPVVIVPARVAALLERMLGLNDVRLRVRGQWAEVDEVLAAWHAVAVQAVDDAGAERHRVRPPGTGLAEPRNPEHAWNTADVAVHANCTTRAVVKAANLGQIAGNREVDGRWSFEQQAAVAWITARTNRRAR